MAPETKERTNSGTAMTVHDTSLHRASEHRHGQRNNLLTLGSMRREWQRDFLDQHVPRDTTEIRGDVNLIITPQFYTTRAGGFAMHEGFEHAVTHFPTILIAAEHTNFHLERFKRWLRREIRWNMDIQIIRAVLWIQERKVRFEEYNVVPAEHWLENPVTREPFTERKDHQGTAGPEGLTWPEAGTDTERKTLRKEQGPRDFILTMTREFWERTSTERRRKLLKAIAKTGTQYPAIVLVLQRRFPWQGDFREQFERDNVLP